MKNKKLFAALTAVISVIVFLGVFLFVWFVGDTYPDFKNFQKQIEIPGLDEGAVPQGITSCEGAEIKDADGEVVAAKQTYFFISAYMNDGSPSRIYVTGEERGYVGYVTVKTEDGEDFYGHCGGIAVNNTSGTVTASTALNYTLWVTGEGKVYSIKSSESYAAAKKTIAQEVIEKAAENESVQITAQFDANCNASFCFYYDAPRVTGLTNDRLYVGEFYRAGNYETAENHVVTTPSGYVNRAFMYEYSVNYGDGNDYGLTRLDETTTGSSNITSENNVPKIQKIFSIPEKIQGAAWAGRTSYGSTDGVLVLSQSYGLANSHLLCFDYTTVISSTNRKYYRELPDKDGNAYGSFKYEGIYKTVGGQKIEYTDKDLYVYYVDKGNEDVLLADYSIPSMAEGLCNVTPNRGTDSSAPPVYDVYVLFESACKKYGLFTRESIKNVYSVNLERLKEED